MPWTSAQSRAQYTAIAWLRWRVFANGFRRKGGTGELITRIITFPIFAALALAPTVLAGGVAWYFSAHGQSGNLRSIFWVIFALSQLLNINLGQPGTTFDPTQLIRFPLRVRSYIAVRMFFGILTPGNIIASLMSLSTAIGITVAHPALWAYAFAACFIFAATNVLFTRMVFAWVDRWLSTRRAREVFTAIIFIGSLGIQYCNVNFNPAYNRHNKHSVSAARLHAATVMYQRVQPLVAWLPPELTGAALVAATAHPEHPSVEHFAADTAACALFASLFFAVFAVRMRTEFRGESFSDQANGVSTAVPGKPRALPSLSATPAVAVAAPSNFGLSATVRAICGKELLTIRRNTGMFYSLIAPIVMVALFAGKLSIRNQATWIFPAALAYALLGIAPLSYNSFGLEGAGAQLYFMLPIRLRDIFLAKNAINFMLGAIEIAAVFCIVTFVAGAPRPALLASSLLWAGGTLLISVIFGNRRSVSAPKKIDLGRGAAKQTSPLSGLISVGILLLGVGFGAGVFLLGIWVHVAWFTLAVMLVYAAVAIALYLRSMSSIERFLLDHRDELFEELCKK